MTAPTRNSFTAPWLKRKKAADLRSAAESFSAAPRMALAMRSSGSSMS
jgi:hypothetical protein